MEEKTPLLETLFEKAENYAKTSVDLYKLKAIDKSADVISTLALKLVFIVVGLLVAIIGSVGLSLWIGEMIGEYYLGFFIVAAFYLLVILILYLMKDQLIKAPVSNAIILQMQKQRAV